MGKIGEGFMADAQKSYVLSIDDDPLIQKVIDKILTSNGYEVKCAPGAREALTFIHSQKPGLILLDVLMPEIDGYEFCASLQKAPETSSIPVIFLTALEAEQSKAKAFAAGGVDYLVKPVEREVLLAKVKAYLETNSRWQGLYRNMEEYGEKTSPAKFVEFKQVLAREIRLASLGERIRSLPPDQIYSLCSKIGISEKQIASQIADFLRIPYLPQIGWEDVLLGILPAAFCRNYSVVPLKGRRSNLVFALSNPFNWELTEALKKFIRPGRLPLEILVTEQENIEALFQVNGNDYRKPGEEPTFLPDTAGPSHPVSPEVLNAEEDQENSPIPSLTKMLLEAAVGDGASDIHVEPKERETLVRLRVDGDMNDFWTLEKSVASKLVSRFKALARMDIAEKRKPQDGSVEVVVFERQFKLRLATASTPSGESLTIRILDPDRKPKTLEELGMSLGQVNMMTQLTGRSSGLILVVGPTGSGKTTTIYSLLSHIDCQTRSLISVEDPVEYRIPFAKQQQVNNKAGVTFEVLLKSLVRQDPDILFIGEVRDPYSAKIAMDFASTGHLTLTTLHTSNATTAIFRLERLEVSRGIMADSILAIVAQRILKKLCPACKTIQPITSGERDLLAPFTAEIPSQTAHPLGCPKCKKTGYLGREGIYEIIHCDAEVASMIRSGRPILEIRQFAHERGDQLISRQAVEKVKDFTFPVKDVYEKVLIEENPSSRKTEPPKIEDRRQERTFALPRILIVEDDLMTQKVVTHFLQNEGYEIVIADDGVEAFLKMGQSHFDLILSDINTPNLDGLRLLEIVQQKGFKIPIILMTGRISPEDEARGLELGAIDYLRKPVQKELLLLRVRKALQNGLMK